MAATEVLPRPSSPGGSKPPSPVADRVLLRPSSPGSSSKPPSPVAAARVYVPRRPSLAPINADLMPRSSLSKQIGRVRKIRVKKQRVEQAQIDRLRYERRRKLENDEDASSLKRAKDAMASDAVLTDEEKIKRGAAAVLKKSIIDAAAGKLNIVPPAEGMSDEEVAALLAAADATSTEAAAGAGKGKPTMMHISDVVFQMQVKRKTDALRRRNQAQVSSEERTPGIRDWPAWLAENTLPRLKQANNKKNLEKDIIRMSKDERLEKDVKNLELKAKSHIVPKLNYKAWSAHVPLPHYGVKPKPPLTMRQQLQHALYYRYDSIGWDSTKKAYKTCLHSPIAEANCRPIFEILKDLLVPAGDEKSLEKCRVLELGSGSGEHGVHFCEQMGDKVIFQPTDVNPTCLKSCDVRSKHYKMHKDVSEII
jgi:hypothetical protein